jgi:ATP-dependent helicase/DNAse subunit B
MSLAATINELPPGSERHLPLPLAHLERFLFADSAPAPPALVGSIRFLEGAGTRGTLELVAEEILDSLRSGLPGHEVGVVVDSVERWRAPLETVFGSHGIAYAIEGTVRLGATPFGAALLRALRFAWQGGGRPDLFAFLRSPFGGLGRPAVDFVEGRLRGRAIRAAARVEEEAERLRGEGLTLLDVLRNAPSPLSGVRALVRGMTTSAYGLYAPTASETAAADLRVVDGTFRLLRELEQLERRVEARLTPDEIVAALERHPVRTAGVDPPGHVAVLDLMRARTRRFDTVFVLGLEEGGLPRRGRGSPFLDDDRRAELGSRLERPDPVERDRYLFYTACTRPRRRLLLVREAASDDGVPNEPSAFWEEVRGLFDPEDVGRWTRRRPLSALTWPVDEAPTERERLRALARLAAGDRTGARALAAANGWQRRLARAERAFDRPTRLSNPAVLEWLAGRTTFSVTELERFVDCSSAWLVERVIDPKTIDAEPDAILRGQLAHTTLHRFYQALPRELGVDKLAPEVEERALELLRRLLEETLATGVRLELTGVQAAELRQTLHRDLEAFVRDETASPVQLVPRRLEVGFGSDRAAAELQRGLALGDGLTLSGKIDRVDVDPFSARGIVQDYKSGKGAYSAREIDREFRLQIPLYLLVLRDLIGIEPIGGVYRALAGKRASRGMLRASAAADLPGFSANDYLDDDTFWAQMETARERAGAYAQRIRAGDVLHDPKGDGCPAWCDLWPICRVERA